MRAAIYARISLDSSGEGQGVERQLEDCRQLVADRGWTLVEEYVDNDVSAYSGKRRPAFERMLQADVDVLVVWRTDRLARRGKDLQRFIDTGMQLTSCTEPEFTGSTGLLMLRILAGFAEHESGVKSERVARKMKSKRANGDPKAGGVRGFGYSADGRSLVPEEACLIQEAARRVVAGETVTDVLRDWTERGIQTVRGGRWSVSNVKRLLKSPRLISMHPDGNAGTWPAVLDRSTWDRLQVVLQVKPNVKTRRYLLTGLMTCGQCGCVMTGSPDGYRCRSRLQGGCDGVSIRSADTDEYVTRMVLAAIPQHNVDNGTEANVEVLLQALRQAEADVSQLAKDHYVDKRIGRPAYLAANEELEARCELLRSQIAEHETGQDLGSLDDIAEQWEHQSVSWQQAVLRTVLRGVEVSKATSTRAPVGPRLRLLWRA